MQKETRPPKNKKKDRFAGAKLAAIPVLLCVLAYVLLGSNEEEAAASVVGGDEPTLPLRHTPGSAVTGRVGTSMRKPWPAVEIQTLMHTNPFADYRVTARASSSVAADHQPDESGSPSHLSLLAQELAQQDVRYRFHSNQRKVVMLGEHLFEEGAHIGNAVRVHDIQAEMLVLSLESAGESATPPAGRPVTVADPQTTQNDAF